MTAINGSHPLIAVKLRTNYCGGGGGGLPGGGGGGVKFAGGWETRGGGGGGGGELLLTGWLLEKLPETGTR